MPNGIKAPVDNRGDWTTITYTSTEVILYKVENNNIYLYLDAKTVYNDWANVGTIPAELRPFYTHYIPAFCDFALNVYKEYHIDKDTGVISCKGNSGSIPIIHAYPRL